jgi:hypothetical protein
VLFIGVDAGRRPVGSVRPEGGAPIAFEGWLSLMAAISGCLAGAVTMPELAPGMPGEPAADHLDSEGAAPAV